MKTKSNSQKRKVTFDLNLSNIVLTILVVACVVLHSSMGRPIWIDEFLHFALGSYENTTNAWNVIQKSILGINHGQTGIYMLLDYWLLKLGGASAFWLRLPSILSGIILYLAAIALFRIWKMPLVWQIMGVLAIFGQNQTMYYLGEARPYMPLVAATVCTFTYYSLPDQKRESLIGFSFGIFSVLIGILFHPYFIFYWFAIVLITYLQQIIEINNNFKFSFANALKHINLWILLLGNVVFFVLGQLTWMRGRPDFQFNFDPFQWVKREDLVKTFFSFSHFEFLGEYIWIVFGLSILSVVLVLLLATNKIRALRTIVTPCLVLIASMLISIFLSYVSLLNHYWILPRQWVASSALTAISFVWLFYSLSSQISKINYHLGLVWIFFLLIPVLLQARLTAYTNFEKMREFSQVSPDTSEISFMTTGKESLVDYFEFPERLNTQKNSKDLVNFSNKYWVALANENIRQGGKVWKGFRGFYTPPTEKFIKMPFMKK
ncbi:MAG: hypothetical protein IM477_07155 [Microcystis sp. M090S1]|uniref:hypothetical protein n=1 Tax=Microcystis sp. M090S1 TaxID=2771135 RepID=UPI0025843D62|nr:hypothetical protein [Microcystis sp. M090S1]MCA2812330.1 hypothetical protein [Microcystis sp. M090S1]